MISRIILGLMCFVVLFLSAPVFAQVDEGFSIYGGLAGAGIYTTVDSHWFGNIGLSFGGDYQFKMSEKISLNPFIMSSFEEFAAITTLTHGILGVEGRYWRENLFYSGRVGLHDYQIKETHLFKGEKLISGSGYGVGFGVGWVFKENWYLNWQFDRAQFDRSFGKAFLNGVRIQVGYRWIRYLYKPKGGEKSSG